MKHDNLVILCVLEQVQKLARPHIDGSRDDIGQNLNVNKEIKGNTNSLSTQSWDIEKRCNQARVKELQPQFKTPLVFERQKYV